MTTLLLSLFRLMKNHDNPFTYLEVPGTPRGQLLIVCLIVYRTLLHMDDISPHLTP